MAPCVKAQIRPIELDRIAPHPRNHDFFAEASVDEVERLAGDMEEHGLHHPIEVVETGEPGNTRFVLVMGHRRTEAARLLGWQTIPAIVRQDTDDPTAPQVVADLIRDNAVRYQPDELALARCYRELKKTYSSKAPKGEAMRDYIAEMLGGTKSGRTFERLERLLDLPREFQDLISEGRLSKAKGAQILAMDKSSRERLYAEVRTHKDLSKALRDAGLQSTPKVSIVDQAIKMVDRVTREAGQLHDQILKAESLSALPDSQRDSIAYLADFFEEWQSKLEHSETA